MVCRSLPISMLVALGGAFAVAPGCGLLLGLDEFTDQPAGVGAGGAAGGPTCTPAVQEPCYSGASATDGVGECKAGARTCSDDGKGWGACEGEILPAVERCDATADENCDSLDCAIWGIAYEQDGSFEPYSIRSDAAGNVLIGGIFTGTIKIGEQTFSAAGSTDGIVAKLGPGGEAIWAKKIGDLLEDSVVAVAPDMDGNVIIAGEISSSIDFGGEPVPEGLYVAKLDPSGEPIWSTGFGGSGFFFDVIVDAAGDIIAAGSFSQSLDPGQGPIPSAGGRDIVVAKLDGASGSASPPGGWVRTAGDAMGQAAWAVAVDSSNNIFVAGEFQGTVDFGGSGTLMADGVDAYLAKITPGGSWSWGLKLGGPGEQQAFGVAVDASGRPVVMGEFDGEIHLGSPDLLSSGGKDVFVLQYSATKQLLWAKSFGDSANQGGKRVAVDSSGNIVIGGYAAGQIDFGQGAASAAGDFDAFVAKLSPAGEPVWSRLLGSAKEDITWSVAVTASMETLAVSTTRAEAADFGTGPLPGGGNGANRRLVVAKLGR